MRSCSTYISFTIKLYLQSRVDSRLRLHGSRTSPTIPQETYTDARPQLVALGKGNAALLPKTIINNDGKYLDGNGSGSL